MTAQSKTAWNLCEGFPKGKGSCEGALWERKEPLNRRPYLFIRRGEEMEIRRVNSLARDRLGRSKKSERRPKEERKERKRHQIVSAAFEIFAKKGFAETTVEEIAELAGVGKGTVYDYFRTKVELLLEAFQMHSVFMEVSDSEKLFGGGDDEEVLKHLALKSFEYAKKNLKLRRLWMMEALKRIPNSSGLFYKTLAAPLIEPLKSYIIQKQRTGEFREGDAFILAHAFWGMLFSFRFWYEMLGGKTVVPRPTEDIVSEVVKLYLQGVRKVKS